MSLYIGNANSIRIIDHIQQVLCFQIYYSCSIQSSTSGSRDGRKQYFSETSSTTPPLTFQLWLAKVQFIFLLLLGFSMVYLNHDMIEEGPFIVLPNKLIVHTMNLLHNI